MIRLIEPWAPFPDDANRVAFEQQLRREIGLGHVLEGIRAVAIARRFDRDDALFALETGGWAIVHLQRGQGAPTSPRWPSTRLFDTLEALEAQIAADAAEFA